MAKQPDQHDDATVSEGGTDPLATENEALTQGGGPLAGEAGNGGAGFGSGDLKKGNAKPSGTRAKSDVPIASDVAPLVHTSMDDDVRAVEEKGHRSARPGADG